MNGQVVGSSKGGRERAQERGEVGRQRGTRRKVGRQAPTKNIHTKIYLSLALLPLPALLPLLLSTSLSARFLGTPVGASPLICLLGDNQ